MSSERHQSVRLGDLIAMQNKFDSERATTFGWSTPITEKNVRPLIHNVLSLAGEAGEVANLVKKFDRGDFDFATLMQELPAELADVAIYLLKLAYQSGVDLEKAILDKMTVNEQRFPISAAVREPDLARHWLLNEAANRAASLTSQQAHALSRMFEAVGLAPPASKVDLAAGALLALEVARLAEMEGYHRGQSSRWEELLPAADAAGFTYKQLVGLARWDSAILETLGIEANESSSKS